MGHICDYYSELHVYEKRGDIPQLIEISRTVTAEWKNKSELVIREGYGEITLSNHVNFGMAGWTVTFTGEKGGYYYGYNKVDVPGFYEVKKRPNFSDIWINKKEFLEELEKTLPSLKYFIKKTEKIKSSAQWIDLWHVYQRHPEIESLCEMYLYNIALDKRLWSFSKEKLKQVINYIRLNRAEMRDNLSDVLFAMKHHVEASKVAYYASNKYQYDITTKLDKWKTDRYTYRHYLGYLTKLGRADDEYWTNPNNSKQFWIRYRTAEEQYNAVIEAERIAKELEDKKQAAAEYRKLSKSLKKISKKYESFTKELDGYKLYVPNGLKDIMNQAKVLNQCLITMSYHKSLAEGKCILVFIKDLEDHPIATAELSPQDYHIRQFYADEYDRKNCKPNEEVTNIFNKYCEMVIPKSSNKIVEAIC